MGDVAVGLIVLAVFFAAMAYVMWSGRLTGPDPEDIEMGAGFEHQDAPEPRSRRHGRSTAPRSADHRRRSAPASAARTHR